MFGSGKGGSAFGSITMILIGFAMIAFASTCFKNIPLIGTVFLMPGDNILNAKMADPKLHYALFLVGGVFTAVGIFLQLRLGFRNTLKEADQDAEEERFINTVCVNLGKVREAKQLLDSGAISEEEFTRIKESYLRPVS